MRRVKIIKSNFAGVRDDIAFEFVLTKAAEELILKDAQIDLTSISMPYSVLDNFIQLLLKLNKDDDIFWYVHALDTMPKTLTNSFYALVENVNKVMMDKYSHPLIYLVVTPIRI